MKKIIFSLAIATSLFACKPSTEKTAAFDLESAKKEIIANNQAFEAAVKNIDSVAFGNLYALDAKWMNPNAPTVEGRAAIVSSFVAVLNAGISSAKLTTVDVWGDENFVTEEGTFELFSKDGAQVDKGKYLVLWKRIDGKLMFYRDMFSSDLAPAAPAK